MPAVAEVVGPRDGASVGHAESAVPAVGPVHIDIAVDLFLPTSSETVTSSVTVSVARRTRSTGTASFSTTGRSSRRVTSCSDSVKSRPRGGVADVVVGDRLALQPYFLALYRDRLGDVLGHHVLAEPRPPGLPRLRADVEPLLRQGHRVVVAATVPTVRRRDRARVIGPGARFGGPGAASRRRRRSPRCGVPSVGCGAGVGRHGAGVVAGIGGDAGRRRWSVVRVS